MEAWWIDAVQSGARDAENAARDTMLELQKKIEEAEQKVALIPRYERDHSPVSG